MLTFRMPRILAVSVLALTLLAAARPGFAYVNLVLVAVPEGCATRVLEVDLYAVSDDQTDQPVSSMDVILSWDPVALGLLGIDDTLTYPYQWYSSGFPSPDPFGLNDTWTDGNGLYTALGRLCFPPCLAYATPEGLWVTRIRFEKLRVGIPTTVAILDTYPSDPVAHTIVYGDEPGEDVTGTLGHVELTPAAEGDLNADGAVDLNDIEAFTLALCDAAAYAAAYPDADIDNADCDCNGKINGYDVGAFVELLLAGS
ncbi:MAG: hypothetical protein JXQ75_05860 [Phycisphaerae bacterium]|nr:hypothetical protein [Phycisphaerae bacterium]